jgi:O-antigen/teichoic acid export membrane protein
MLSLLFAVAALKLAAITFDAANFGLYNIVRRYISILNYPLLMGLGISIPIYLAKSTQSRPSQARLVTTGILWWIFLTIFLISINLSFPGMIIQNILGKGYKYLEWPVLFGFSSLYLYTILYATYRGEQNFARANLFQVVSAGLLPLTALYYSNGIVERFFYIYSTFLLLVNILVLADLYHRQLISKINKTELKTLSTQFMKFGLPRVPGEFALFGLMSVPLFFIARYDSLEMAGYVAIGFTIVQLVASFFEFTGTLMLPQSAQLISEKQYAKLNDLVRKQSLVSFICAILLSLVIYFNLEFLLSLLDKKKFIEYIGYSKIIIVCIPFYIIYLIIRNPQDALSIKPINTYNLIFCFFLQSILLLFSFNISGEEMRYHLYNLSVIIPFVLLGFLSFITWDLQIKKHLE